jgi:hypothetical protein
MTLRCMPARSPKLRQISILMPRPCPSGGADRSPTRASIGTSRSGCRSGWSVRFTPAPPTLVGLQTSIDG